MAGKLGVVGALALACLNSTARAEDLQLAPASAWLIDYADDSCALRRTFGGEGQRVSFELRQFAPGEDFLVTAASADLKVLKTAPRSQFEPDGPVERQPLAAYGAYGEGAEGVSFPVTLHWDSPRMDPAQLKAVDRLARDSGEKSITGLRLTAAFDHGVLLQTGPLFEPLKAMHGCLDDLLTEWGIDPEVNRSLSKVALPIDQDRWANAIRASFPTSLIRLGLTARVQFRLILDASGKPESCRVIRPVVSEEYQRGICRVVMERAEFEPALDASGQPVKSLYLFAVLYETN